MLKFNIQTDVIKFVISKSNDFNQLKILSLFYLNFLDH